jgi:hypothetical protein
VRAWGLGLGVGVRVGVGKQRRHGGDGRRPLNPTAPVPAPPATPGCKLNNVPIVYTPWSNLKKTADMDVGQVRLRRGFGEGRGHSPGGRTQACSRRPAPPSRSHQPPPPPTPTHPAPKVGFVDAKRVRKAKVERKVNDILNRLEKTRTERNPDLRAEKEVRARRGGGGGGCGGAATWRRC